MRKDKKADTQYQDGTLVAVAQHENGYEIQFKDGGWLSIDDPGFEPKPGDPVRTYGKGIGYPVRGLDIAGGEVYYQTEEEYRAEFNRRTKQEKRLRCEELEGKGGVSHDPGTGRYDWRDGMGEISGFGDEYEAACRAMLIRSLDFWDEQDEDFDPKYHGFKDVYGICVDDNEDAKKLDEAMMNAFILFGNGQTERVGDGASGAMHQAVVSHAFYVRRNGWSEYVRKMTERADGRGEEG